MLMSTIIILGVFGRDLMSLCLFPPVGYAFSHLLPVRFLLKLSFQFFFGVYCLSLGLRLVCQNLLGISSFLLAFSKEAV